MRLAVVLFNLGGPDRPDAIRPFLTNLFSDPAIIGAPGFVRLPLARFIAWRREKVARTIYDHLGGKSPLLELTRAQARALEESLADIGEVRCFVCMRYWHPMSAEVAKDVAEFAPDRVLLVPLYPQYSTTTTGSSLANWTAAARRAGVTAPTTSICCWPTEPGFVDAVADLVESGLADARSKGTPRLLFSAHGLPKKVIESGDPYQWQVERTAAAVVERIGPEGLDWTVCYQSRVGPLEWIGPSTEAELQRAARDQVPVVVVPIAFVSEHSETLVELDIEYREEADRLGIPGYVRVAAVGTHPRFIQGLEGMARAAIGVEAGTTMSTDGTAGRICPGSLKRCAQACGLTA